MTAEPLMFLQKLSNADDRSAGVALNPRHITTLAGIISTVSRDCKKAAIDCGSRSSTQPKIRPRQDPAVWRSQVLRPVRISATLQGPEIGLPVIREV
jgi:hypothetical protein